MPVEDYIATIGLEVHAQLLTRSKIFSGDPTSYGSAPNSNVNPISLGHPGTLPKLNRKAVELAVKMGLACHSGITKTNRFARKNYFYADLPKGYQITQDDTPICKGGHVAIRDAANREKNIRLVRIHLEEDSGKSIHDLDPYNSLIDLNRAGVGLIEIVTEPDIADETEAYNYLSEVRKMVRYLDICDGNMEEGSLRCDANVSVRKKGTETLGQRTEIKNMNSLRNVKKAISFEIHRQVELLEQGEKIQMETRGFDAVKGQTVTMRAKEEAHDYRYFPEPDLQFVELTDKEIDDIRSKMPKLPFERFLVYTEQYGLSEYDARVLTEDRETSDYFEKVLKFTENYKATANWVMGPIRSFLNEHAKGISEFQIAPKSISELIKLIDDGQLNHTLASQKLFPLMLANPDKVPSELARENQLIQEQDGELVVDYVIKVLGDHPGEVERYQSGEKKLLGFFMGELMKLSKGKVEPKSASAALKEKLEE